MADSDRVGAPFAGRLPSEFLRAAAAPKTTITAGRSLWQRTDAAPPPVRRVLADVRLPCMLYAAVGVLPGSSPLEAELAMAETRRSPGVVQVIAYSGLICETTGLARPEVAVVARGFWLARQGLARLLGLCGGAVARPAANPVQEDVACSSRVTRATAHFVQGRLRLWLGTAEADATRTLAARMAGVGEQFVDLRVVGEPLGGAPRDILTAALALARQLEPAPVQVIVAPEVKVPLAGVERVQAGTTAGLAMPATLGAAVLAA